MKSLSSNSYVAAHIDNVTHELKLYFQQKKSQQSESYKKDEAYIETQSGHQIKASCSDQGGGLQSEAIIVMTLEQNKINRLYSCPVLSKFIYCSTVK